MILQNVVVNLFDIWDVSNIINWSIVLLIACSAGRWGVGCQQICKCDPSVCDNVNGCISCSSPSLTGPNCTQHFNVCTTVTTNPCNSTYSTCMDTNTTAYCQCIPWYTPGGSGTYGCIRELFPMCNFYYLVNWIFCIFFSKVVCF